jgi:hypothetical protein
LIIVIPLSLEPLGRSDFSLHFDLGTIDYPDARVADLVNP